MKTFSVEKLFPSHVFSMQLDLDLVIRDGRNRTISNVGGLQFEQSFPQLNKEVEAYMHLIMGYLGVHMSTSKVVNSWVNINQRGHWNKPHIHPGSFYSAVYFIAGHEACGDLVLLNGHNNIAGVSPYAPKLRAEHRLKPLPGMLYMFPSGQSHMVEPNNTDTPRISVALNIVTESSIEHRLPGNHTHKETHTQFYKDDI